MIDPLQRRATREDLDALPRSVVGELIQGVLYTRTRPRPRHAGAASVLGGDLNGPYQRGRGGPGGWWILDEPGIELAALDVEEIVPDVAGWQRARLPTLPDGPITIAPDWVCEVLSPSSPWWKSRVPRTPSAAALARRETEGIPGVFRGRATPSASSGAVLSVRGTSTTGCYTRAHDLKLKRPLYARAGVRWMWLVDVDARTLNASRQHDGSWLEIGTWSDEDVARIEPFDAVEIHLAELWGAAAR